MPKARPIQVAFWEKVQQGAEDECWPWSARRFRNNYGAYTLPRPERRTTTAHRVAYELHHGRTVPDGMDVHHTCHNPACCNPHHLEVQTPYENRGEWNRSKTHCKHGHPYDEKNTYRNRGKRFCRPCGAARATRYRKET